MVREDRPDGGVSLTVTVPGPLVQRRFNEMVDILRRWGGVRRGGGEETQGKGCFQGEAAAAIRGEVSPPPTPPAAIEPIPP